MTLPVSSNTTSTESDGLRWQMFLLLAAAAYSPFTAYVRNEESPSLATAVVVTVLVTVLAIAIRWALIMAGLDPLGSTYAVGVFVVSSTNFGALIASVPGGRWTTIVVCLLLAILASLLRNLRLFRWIVAFGAFALVASPLVEGLASAGEGSLGLLTSEMAAIAPLSADNRDIVVIVADGYPARRVLEALYGIDNRDFYDQVEEEGIQISHDAVANYPFTVLSVPNTLEIEYVAGEQTLSRADFDDLYDMLGGSNRMAEWLTASGYRQTYVESGWLGTSCTELVDDCINAQWPDESLYDVAARSLLRGAPGFEEGRSFGMGTLNTMNWVENEMTRLLVNNQRDYVYLHLLAPHAPLFLDPDCSLDPDPRAVGFTMAGGSDEPDPDLSYRIDAFGQQLRCVNRILLGVARQVTEHGGVLLMLGDHGTDLGGQLYVDGMDWDEAMRWERFRPLVAGYGDGCEFGHVGSLVNLGRRLAACLGNSGSTDIDDLSYVATKTWDLMLTSVPETMDG